MSKGRKFAARKLYFEYRSAKEICKATGVLESTLGKWIYGNNGDKSKSWKVQRAALSQEFLQEVIDDKTRKETAEIFSLSLPSIRRSIEFRSKLSIPFTIEECQAVTSILLNLDKLRRIDKGRDEQPEDEQNNETVDFERIAAAMKSDKFFELVSGIYQYAQHRQAG